MPTLHTSLHSSPRHCIRQGPMLMGMAFALSYSLYPLHAQSAPATAAATLATSAAPAVAPSEAPSRIASVKLYPGSATIERVARLAAGSRSYTFRCLPAALDAASVQTRTDAAVRIGETRIEVQERDIAGGCTSALEERWRTAQDQVAHAKAQTQALELAHSYLKATAHSPAEGATAASTLPPAPLAPPSPSTVAAMVQALQRQTQETLQQLHQAQRRLEAAELALKAIAVERERIASAHARVSTVTVTLATAQEADLRLSYQVRGPSWSPSYRASLDGSSTKVRLERLALVAQNTGEDWAGVPLTLSTGMPQRASAGTLPRPWRFDVAPPPAARTMAAAAPPAPAPAAPMPKHAARMAVAESAAEEDALPKFEVSVTDSAYATEFSVPQRITVPSGGQRVTLSLGQHEARAQLLIRTAPATEEAAYLVAQFPAPPGVWPTANVALYRDGAFVGNGRFDSAELARAGLSFGRDERVVVRSDAVRENTTSVGLTGSTTERHWQRTYHVENRHDQAIELQVLEAAPVSKNERIRIQSQYQPAPTEPTWNQQAGTLAWRQRLGANASARFEAQHTISYPKDLHIQEQRY